MNLINFDFSNINESLVDVTPLLKLLEKENIICFFKGFYVNNMGFRIVDNDENKSYNLQFIEIFNLVDSTFAFDNFKINKNDITKGEYQFSET